MLVTQRSAYMSATALFFAGGHGGQFFHVFREGLYTSKYYEIQTTKIKYICMFKLDVLSVIQSGG